MLLREQILCCHDLRSEPLQIPEWDDCTVHIPVLTVKQAEELYQFTKDAPYSPARIAVYVARDEHGERIFSDADVDALSKKSSVAVNRIVEAYNRVNGGAEKKSESLPV